MPLSWNETWEESCRNALAIGMLNEGHLFHADLQAIRLRLRRACLELSRLLAVHQPIRTRCKLCGEPLGVPVEQQQGMCMDCLADDLQDAEGYGVDLHSFRSEK